MERPFAQESFSRVLVVEDDPMQRRTLAEMLSDEGFEVVGCASGADALAEFEKRRARVAILDLRLPDITGVQLLDRLEAFADHVSIIINTGHCSYESARDALNFGAFAYVEKAGDPQELLRYVHRAVAYQLQRRTERLEAAVSANRAHLASVFRAAPIGIGLVCRSTLVEINDRLCRMTGYAAEELIGHEARVLYPSDPEYEDVEAAGNGQATIQTTETRWRRKNGEILDILLSWTRLDPDEPSKGVTFTALDITHSKRAAESLRRNEQLLREAERIAHVGSFSRDIATGQTVWSDEAYRIFGYEPGRTSASIDLLLRHVHPDDRDAVIAAVDATPRDGYHGIEYRIIRKDGQQRIVHSRKRTEVDDSGRLVRRFGAIQDVTEQREAEAALRNSEARSRELAELLPQTVFELDAAGKLTFANHAAIAAFGYGPQELTRLDVFRLVADDDRERLAQNLPRRVTDGAFTDHEYTAQRKDGTTFPVLVYSTPIVKDGQFAGLRGIILDITERRRAETALQESKAKLESILESSPNAIIVLAPDGPVEDCNQATLEIFGLTSKDEIIGRSGFDFVAPEHIGRAQEALAETIAKGAVRNMEIRLLHHPDGVFTAQISASVMTDPAGDLLGIVVVAADISERKRAEERLRAASDMLDIAPSSIMVHDFEGRFLYANRKTFEIHGFSAAEFMAMNLHDLDAPESEALIAERMQIIVAAGEASFEVAHFRKDGSTFPLEIDVKRVTWDDADAILSIGTDITERKRAGEALRESERILSTLMGNLPGMAYRCLDDQQWTMEFASEGCHALTGYSSADLIGNRRVSYNDLIHPDDRRRVREDCRRDGDRAAPFELEYRILTADGQEKWVWERGRRVLPAPGAPMRLEGFVLDITDYRHAQEALRQSEYLLRESQKVANLGHYALDVKTGVWESSEVLDDIFGIAQDYPKTVDGWLHLVHPDDREGMSRYLSQHVLGEHHAFDREYRIVRASDSTIRWVWGLGRLDMTAQGEPLRLIGVIQDITVRKEAADSLRDYQAKLKSLASELSLAEERERRRIAGDLHDHACQTLALSKMKLQAMLERITPTDEQTLRQICDSLNQTIESIRELTFDLSSPTLYKFGLEAALEELLCDKLKAEHHIRYRFFDDKQPKRLAPNVRVLLFQSVRELLINVIKHAQADEVRLDIRRDGDSISIIVTDDGVGFDVETVWSASAQRRSVGLFNVRERLDYVGGRLEMESYPGKGSRFILIAPLERDVSVMKENRDGS